VSRSPVLIERSPPLFGNRAIAKTVFLSIVTPVRAAARRYALLPRFPLGSSEPAIVADTLILSKDATLETITDPGKLFSLSGRDFPPVPAFPLLIAAYLSHLMIGSPVPEASSISFASKPTSIPF